MLSQTIIPTHEAVNTWQQCIDALSESSVAVSEDFQYQAQRVFSLSEFINRQLYRKPQLLLAFINSGRFDQCLSYQQMQDLLLQQLQGINSEQQLQVVLRQFRNQQMIAIYWRDLLDLATVKETCAQVSILADICIQQAHQWLHAKLCQEMQLEHDKHQPAQLLVIGMGKLGGKELNVSSDIDLIFCYQGNAQTDKATHGVDDEKFYNLLARRLIKSLDQITADGFVFRVDMRLRPYGDSGPLVMSFSALEEYYQDQGRDWERFALIKARMITGSDPEKQQIKKLLKPFVFRRYIDYSVLESPRQMKNLINQELRRRNLADNIKLGPGGIREVEFIAQAQQLIHGGRETSLQCRSLFNSLPRLGELDLLPASMVEELLESYLFLRKVEHRLQAVKDQQTQELPVDKIEQQRLAEGLNYRDWKSFRTVTLMHMEKIHHHFNSLFHDDNESPKIPETTITFHDIWQGCNSEQSSITSIIEQVGFKNTTSVISQLLSFKNSSAVRLMGPRGAKRLDQLMPSILQTIAERQDQDESLHRILRLLSSITTRTAYLELLAENKGALQQLIQLCSASARIADQIADYPYVLDELINPNTLFHPPEISRLPDRLRQALCRIPEDDVELQMDCLREFRQINLLRITAADIAGALTVRQLSRYLTAIAETIIESVYNLAWQQLSKKHGVPEVEKQGFAIIAYGKLGGHELGYGSDLDLVFLHDAEKGLTDGDKPLEKAIFYMRLAQKIIALLSIRTRSGVLYEVDMRLRPSGNSGLLVSHIDAFIDYQKQSAWTWEHQALIRGRCILGSGSLWQQFEKIRTTILCQKRDQKELGEQVVQMREKMRGNLLEPNLTDKGLFNLKQSKGGVTDIEFLTQYLVLKLAASEPGLVISSNTSELLSFLATKENLSDPRLKDLIAVYASLRGMVNKNALQNNSNTIKENELADIDIKLVTQLWSDLLCNLP